MICTIHTIRLYLRDMFWTNDFKFWKVFSYPTESLTRPAGYLGTIPAPKPSWVTPRQLYLVRNFKKKKKDSNFIQIIERFHFLLKKTLELVLIYF